jgi:hypothetical protein
VSSLNFYTNVLKKKKKKQSGPSLSRPPYGEGYYGRVATLAVGAACPGGAWMQRVLPAVGSLEAVDGGCSCAFWRLLVTAMAPQGGGLGGGARGRPGGGARSFGW